MAQPIGAGSEPVAEELIAVPRQLRAGEETTVSGEGCASGNRVRFNLYNPELQSSAEAVAQGDGTFVHTIRLPSTTKVGRAWLRATCLTDDSTQKTMEAVLLVSRPQFVITGTNIAFGLGTALVTAGIGLAMLRQPHHPGRGSSIRKRRKRRRRRGGEASAASPGSEEGTDDLDAPDGAELNGTRDKANRTIEVD